MSGKRRTQREKERETERWGGGGETDRQTDRVRQMDTARQRKREGNSTPTKPDTRMFTKTPLWDFIHYMSLNYYSVTSSSPRGAGRRKKG